MEQSSYDENQSTSKISTPTEANFKIRIYCKSTRTLFI